MTWMLILIAVGFALLVAGATVLVDGASGLARTMGLSDRVVGLTVVAVGTAMPEIVVSVASAASGHTELALGNVIGSNICNLLLVLGLTALTRRLELPHKVTRFDVPISVVVTLFVMVLANVGGAVSRIDGIILILAFIAFVAYSVFGGRDEEEQEAEAEEPAVKGVPLQLAYVAAGVALLKFGGDFVVDSSVDISFSLGIPESVVGLTVVAIGTCLPELITSVVAARRGNVELALGNVLGSNITNLLLVLGVPAAMSGIVFDASYNLELIALAGMTASLVLIAHKGDDRLMYRRHGLAFTGMYLTYLIRAMFM